MFHFDWRTTGRAALVVSFLTFFGAITVIGQVAEPGPVPEAPAFLLDHR